MAWTTPKTDWKVSYDSDGVYNGDRFNYADFNRLVNNLKELRELSIKLYNEFAITTTATKNVTSYLYADDFNKIEENLEVINTNTLNRDYGDTQTYYANGNTFDYKELNRIESAMLDLYERLSNQYNSRRMLTFNFGTREGF